MKPLYFIAFITLIIGCSSSKQDSLIPGWCISQKSPIEKNQIDDNDLNLFNQNLKIINAGHYIAGKYQFENQIILASVIESGVNDSILNSLAQKGEELQLDENHKFVFVTNEELSRGVLRSSQNNQLLVFDCLNKFSSSDFTQLINQIVESCE